MSNITQSKPNSQSSESEFKATSSDAEKEEDTPTIVEHPSTAQYAGTGSKEDPFVVCLLN